nr:uncharacterized protein LOC111501868 [Leptinotarsa decemlineata]
MFSWIWTSWIYVGSIPELMETIQDDENIGAVISEIEINVTLLKLQKALTYLKRKDCLFIVGASNLQIPVGPLGPVIGSKPFQDILRDFSGREPYRVGKPSLPILEHIIEKYEITDKSRVLFVGDSIEQDLILASMANFKKLLVLTGDTKIEDLHNWKFLEEHKPDYYLESIGDLAIILNSIL